MFRNYLKVAFRNIFRHKAFSLLNISGLAVGMASSILILLWVQHELSFDRFNVHALETYRITRAFCACVEGGDAAGGELGPRVAPGTNAL
jgi:putative ABC transport system permease protein